MDEEIKKIKVPYYYGKTKLGEFSAEKFEKCSEVFFTEEASDKIDKKAKELGFWGRRSCGAR